MSDAPHPTPSRSAHRRALSYIDASREFYAAHGYEQPYQWAVHEDAPLQRLSKPLGRANVAIVTTTFPHGATQPKRVMSVPATPTPESLFTADLSWHKEATHTDDVGSFLPIEALRRAGDRIGSINDRFFCVPTEYSQRATKQDAAQVVEWCKEDSVDIVLLIPL